MLVIEPMTAGVGLEPDILESRGVHGRGHGGGLLGVGNGIAGAIAEKEGHRLEPVAGLEQLDAQRGAVLVAAAHENSHHGPAVVR